MAPVPGTCQVAEELEQLTKHQQVIGKAGTSVVRHKGCSTYKHSHVSKPINYTYCTIHVRKQKGKVYLHAVWKLEKCTLTNAYMHIVFYFLTSVGSVGPSIDLHRSNCLLLPPCVTAQVGGFKGKVDSQELFTGLVGSIQGQMATTCHNHRSGDFTVFGIENTNGSGYYRLLTPPEWIIAI